MMRENKKIAKAAGVIGISTLLSRVLGFVRDMVVAWFFGAGLLSDAFFVAFRIPNLLRRLFAEGSLSIAFVPVFAEHLARQGKPEAFRMARSALRMLSLILVAVTLLGILAAPGIVRVIAPGFTGMKFSLTVTLTRIMFPYIFFISLVALCMGILNVLGHFAAPALAPVLLNLSIIGAVLFISPHLNSPVFGLAIGVLIGGILQLALQVPFLIQKKFYFWQKATLYHPGLKRIGTLMLPTVFGAAVYQINILIGTLLASLLPEGSVSYLYYADRLVQFPLGIFAISLSVAVLPSLSRLAAEKNMADLKKTFVYAMNLIFFITLPAMAGLIVLRQPMIALLFERGAFDPESTRLTALALVYYSVGLWAFAAVRVVVSTFYSLQDTVTPVKMATVSIIANLLLSLGLMGPLQHGGLALATSLASILNLGLLAWALQKKLGTLEWQKIMASVLRSVVCSIIMGTGLWMLAAFFSSPEPASTLRLLAMIAVGVTAGAILYFVSAVMLGCQEVYMIYDMMKKGKRS
jgi:putative peptidoglycan lipid II flippase